MVFKPARRPSIFLPIPLQDDTIKVYQIKAPTAEVGILIKQAMTLGQAKAAGRELTAEEEAILDLNVEDSERFDQQLFGGQKQQMLDDGVDAWTFGIVRQTVMIWVNSGQPVAEHYWNTTIAAEDEPDDDAAEGESEAPKDSSDGEKKARADSPVGSTSKVTSRTRGRGSSGSTSSATGRKLKPTSTNATE